MTGLCDARRILEGMAAALCDQRATEGHLQDLGRLPRELHLYPNSPAGCDQGLRVDFHLALAAASKNEILGYLLGAIRNLVRESVARSQQLPGSHEPACDQHLEIVGALTERNPRKARRAIHRPLWSFEQAYEILAHAPKSESEAQDLELRKAQESRA